MGEEGGEGEGGGGGWGGGGGGGKAECREEENPKAPIVCMKPVGTVSSCVQAGLLVVCVVIVVVYVAIVSRILRCDITRENAM